MYGFLIFPFFCAFGFFRILPLFDCFLSSMLSSSEVRALCPSVSFLFECLGASLGISRNFYPLFEDFMGGGNSLSLVLTDLFPFLRESANWFEDLVSDRKAMSEVISSELEMGLSSSDDPVEEDTTISTSRVVRAFSALDEECGLDAETLSRFKDRFQFPERVRIRLPCKEERACHFRQERYVFMRLLFKAGLDFQSTPL